MQLLKNNNNNLGLPPRVLVQSYVLYAQPAVVVGCGTKIAPL